MKLLIIAIFLSQFSYAGIIGDTEITGKVVRFDKKTVTISKGKDKRVTVPKKSLKGNPKKLKSGMEVTAVFSAEEIMDKIEAQQKNK